MLAGERQNNEKRDSGGESSGNKSSGVPGIAILFMLLSALFFSVMAILAKHLYELGIPPMESVFFRSIIAFVFMIPFALRKPEHYLKTQCLNLHILRSIFGACGMSLFFISLVLLPQVRAVALNFSLPLFVTIGAGLILKEKVGFHRLFAVLFGFIGVFVITGAQFDQIELIDLLPVIAALFMAGGSLCVKKMSQTEPAGRMVFFQVGFVGILTFIPATFSWVWPNIESFLWLCFLGVAGNAAQLFLNKAYQHMDASVLVIFHYLRLPIIAFLAYIIFGQVPQEHVWYGACILISTALYIAYRENKHKLKPSIFLGR